eukprot:365120-Chlamydomonas_euryale.AAC.2
MDSLHMDRQYRLYRLYSHGQPAHGQDVQHVQPVQPRTAFRLRARHAESAAARAQGCNKPTSKAAGWI